MVAVSEAASAAVAADVPLLAAASNRESTSPCDEFLGEEHGEMGTSKLLGDGEHVALVESAESLLGSSGRPGWFRQITA
jgi:hypothetical protein